jgi:cobalt-zinc-cadmium efflux system outer membrane protein
MNNSLLSTIVTLKSFLFWHAPRTPGPKNEAKASIFEGPLTISTFIAVLLLQPTLSHGEPGLMLSDAVAKTLAQSKELEAYAWEQRVEDGKILQAGLLPNPQLSIAPENVVGSEFFRKQIQNTVEISQLIELGEKRSNRVKVAEYGKEKSLTDYEIKRNEVLAELNIRFVHVLSDQLMVELMRRSSQLAARTLDVVRSRIKAGGGAGYEEPRTRVLVAKAQIAEEHTEHELLSSSKLLASSWNAEELGQSVVGDLLAADNLFTLQELYDKLNSSPAVLQGRVEERLRQAILSLEEAKKVPDVTFGIGWRYGRSLDEQAAVANLTIPLQIFDSNQGNIAEAKALSLKKKIENEALPVRLKAAVFELYQEIKHAKTELDLMKKEIIPQSERSLTLVQEGYKIGRHTFLELSESQSAVIENHAAQIKAALTFHKLSIELNQLLGGPNYELQQ